MPQTADDPAALLWPDPAPCDGASEVRRRRLGSGDRDGHELTFPDCEPSAGDMQGRARRGLQQPSRRGRGAPEDEEISRARAARVQIGDHHRSRAGWCAKRGHGAGCASTLLGVRGSFAVVERGTESHLARLGHGLASWHDRSGLRPRGVATAVGHGSQGRIGGNLRSQSRRAFGRCPGGGPADVVGRARLDRHPRRGPADVVGLTRLGRHPGRGPADVVGCARLGRHPGSGPAHVIGFAVLRPRPRGLLAALQLSSGAGLAR